MVEKWKLYRVVLKVRPTPQHVDYYEFEIGMLCFYLYAPSETDAVDRAHKITRLLPFEVAAQHARIFPATLEPNDKETQVWGKQPLLIRKCGPCTQELDCATKARSATTPGG